ncbi:hypothetical protein [Stutzerimonas nitrititolerans]|uniref:hypothetical protein n=1 Tax=Stutzerimonas nitrititolerans TaxID=2482751 RepID=UPI0028B186E6|nr:hypothetical protein [Stutzerimonas nitrititolerans]
MQSIDLADLLLQRIGVVASRRLQVGNRVGRIDNRRLDIGMAGCIGIGNQAVALDEFDETTDEGVAKRQAPGAIVVREFCAVRDPPLRQRRPGRIQIAHGDAEAAPAEIAAAPVTRLRSLHGIVEVKQFQLGTLVPPTSHHINPRASGGKPWMAIGPPQTMCPPPLRNPRSVYSRSDPEISALFIPIWTARIRSMALSDIFSLLVLIVSYGPYCLADARDCPSERQAATAQRR